MKALLELDDKGELRVPAAMLPGATPHARYHVEVWERQVLISPVNGELFWQQASAQERAADILQWAESHRQGPGLPDQAITREGLYD